MFMQHAKQTRVLHNGHWTLVEADVPSRSTFAQTFLHRALQCNVGGVEVFDNVYATGIMATCTFVPGQAPLFQVVDNVYSTCRADKGFGQWAMDAGGS